MKYAVMFILLLCSQAKAGEESVIWLVAPEIWSADIQEIKSSIQNLEVYLQQSLGKKTKVELKTSAGFALSQYFHLKEQLKTTQPDYIFYIQSSRMFAKDFEEVILSKNLPNRPLNFDFFSDDEILNNQPTWSKILVPGLNSLLPIKKAIFTQNRVEKHWNIEGSATDKAEFYLDISFVPLRSTQFVLQDKSRVIFLISPERTRYSREIFPDNQFIGSLAQMFFSGVSIDKNEIKEYLAYSGFNFQLLAGDFYQLSRPENLMGGMQAQLNSNGVNKSFQIIKPVISSYLVMEKNRKDNEEKLKTENRKPKSDSRKKKTKSQH